MKKKAALDNESLSPSRKGKPQTWEQKLRAEYSEQEMTNQQIEIIGRERKQQYEMVGIAEDNSIVNLKEIEKNIKVAQSKLPNFRKKARFLNLQQLKKEIQDSTSSSQWPELSTGIDQWKKKYLYPFGNIAPIPDDQAQGKEGATELLYDGLISQASIGTDTEIIKKNAFQRLVRVKYQFPADIISQKQEWITDLQKPLNITVSDIRRDLRKFVMGFPIHRIPHSTEADEYLKKQKAFFIKAILNGDPISLGDQEELESATLKTALKNLSPKKMQAPKKYVGLQQPSIKDLDPDQRELLTKLMASAKQSYNMQDNAGTGFGTSSDQTALVQNPRNNLHFLKTILTESHIKMTFDEIQSERMAKLIGLCAHFCYWAVFGGFNPMPLDDYHMKQLFIAMLQCMTAIENKYVKNSRDKQLYTNFMMPMFILGIRVEVEMIFKMNYKTFLISKDDNQSNKANIEQVLRLLNGVITEIFDPNIFYSRLSFLESGKDAIDIKNELNAGKQFNGYKLPNIQNKFFTRSTLVKNLIPLPSEGKVRAKFGQGETIIQYPTAKKLLPKLEISRSTLDNRNSGVYNSVQRPLGHVLLGQQSSNMKDEMQKQSLFQSNISSTQMDTQRKTINQRSASIANPPQIEINFRDQVSKTSMKVDDQVDREQKMLDMINKVQMFQIACNKVNSSLKKRKLEPIFKLQINEQKKTSEQARSPTLEVSSPGDASKAGSHRLETGVTPHSPKR